MSTPNSFTNTLQSKEYVKLIAEKRKIAKQIKNMVLEKGGTLSDQISEEMSSEEIQKFVEKQKLFTGDPELIKKQQEYFKVVAEIDYLTLDKKDSEKKDWMLKYPNDLGDVPYKKNFIIITFYEYQVDLRTNNKLEKIVNPKIMIPISSRLLYSSIQLDYSNEALGQFNNVLFENARDYGATISGIGAAIGNSYQEGSAANMTEGFLMSQLLRTDLKAVRAGYHGSGLAYNENITAKFLADQPKTRTFFPSWTFVPKNRRDALVLSDILRAIKRNTLPTTMNENVDAKLNYNNNFRYPRIVKLQLFIDGKEYKKAGFLPMSIQRYEISNNDKTASSISDNVPLSVDEGDLFNTETTLNLTLKELNVFTRDHVDDVFKVK